MAPPESVTGTLSLKAAATACGVSESTIRRNRAKLRENGARQTQRGWEIPVSALIAAGLMEAPQTPRRSTPPASSNESPLTTQLDALRDDLADARADAREHRARVELLDRERGELIRRAEAAEATAREATAAAAALALTVKTLESARQQVETGRQNHLDAHQAESEAGQVPKGGSTDQRISQEPSVRSVWGRARKIFRR